MVLYINGNYPYHSLHEELVSRLADLGNEVTVFVPIKGDEMDGKYCSRNPNVNVLYCDCLMGLDRLFFLAKVHRIATEIEKKIDMRNVDCILAGTVYSDGVVAYLLSQKYGVPFSIAVRETDVTYQMRWRPYLNGIIKSVLTMADKVIFLSPSYKYYLDRFGIDPLKYKVIPNAVNDYWFTQRQKRRTLHDPLSLIYVGEISKRKNVSTSIYAVAELKKRGVKAILHIVGSGDEEGNCHILSKKLGVDKEVVFHGWQNGKEKIKALYDQADIFIMLSHKETFGTVYIEALSQGLPVLYTIGQGIDGYFDQGSVGYSCDPLDVKGITDKILSITKDYSNISMQCVEASQGFQWDIIAREYDAVICGMREQ